MTGRANYSAEEWRTVGGLPYYAAAYVVSSAPHHVIGTARDMLSAASDFSSEAGRVTENALIRDALADSTGPNGDPGPTKNEPENIARLKTAVQAAAALLDAHDPTDGPAYKALVVRVAEKAAAASRDGLFAAKGEAINEDEARALTELRDLLGTPAD